MTWQSADLRSTRTSFRPRPCHIELPLNCRLLVALPPYSMLLLLSCLLSSNITRGKGEKGSLCWCLHLVLFFTYWSPNEENRTTTCPRSHLINPWSSLILFICLLVSFCWSAAAIHIVFLLFTSIQLIPMKRFVLNKPRLYTM